MERRGRWRSGNPNDRRRNQNQSGTQSTPSIFELARQQHQAANAERTRDSSTTSNGTARERSPNGIGNWRESGGNSGPNESRNVHDRSVSRDQGSRGDGRPRHERNDDRNRNFSRPPVARQFPMGYKALESLLTKQPGEVIFSVKSPKSGFKELLNFDGLENNKLVMCLHAMAIACATDHTRNLTEFLKMLLEECQQFLNSRLVRYLIEIQNNPTMYQLNSMAYMLDLIEGFQSTVPRESLLTTQLLVPQISTTINRLHSIVGHGSELIGRVEKIEQTKTKLLDRYTTIHGATRKDEDQVPNDFREIPIFPDKIDLVTNKRPFLRPNVIEGRYMSADHYLDVQFRLIREDFVRPLREGIAAYLDQIRNNRRERLQDIKVYQNVKITKIILSDDGVLHELHFDTAGLGNVRWEKSKRLIYGALVCLTSDNFETLYFGTVGERKVEKLVEGRVAVKFEKQDEIMDAHSETFTMVETEAYFEASRYILSALQDIDEKHFPMKEYIVELDKQMREPRYLTNDSVYCLRPLTKLGYERTLAASADLSHANCTCTLGSKRLPVHLFRNDEWPSPDDLSLDHSQFDALKSALTQKISIIQGPPGTGKTHVGLKIMEILLHNQNSWNNEIRDADDDKNPILIVCYTNHALDQFLEGVLELTEKIVRMGGRSESEKLKPFQMNNLKRIMARSRDGRNYVGRDFRCMKFEMESILQNIKAKERALKTCGNDVLSEIDLKNEISDDLFASFHSHAPKFLKLCNRDTGKVLKYWLGVNVPEHLHSIPDENALIVEVFDEPPETMDLEVHTHSDPESDQEGDGELDLNASDYEDVEDQPDEKAPINRDVERNTNIHKVAQRVAPVNRDVERNTDVHEEAVVVSPPRLLNFDDEDREWEYDDDIDYILNMRMENAQEYRNARVVLLDNQESEEETHPQNDDWKTQGGKKQQRKYLKSQLRRLTVLSQQELLETRNIWTLKMEDRWRLYKTWLDLYIKNETEKIDDLKKDYERKLAAFGEIKTEEEVIVAKSALVIGMTTTGAAKYRHLVRNIKSKIVIVEEAAEVLEAQIVTSLSKHTEHLILIGDHQQLRPNPVVYDLAKKYHLEISLFERLIKNGIPFVRLGIQHRMKPSISRLLVPHIYDQLEDHPSVGEYEEVSGFEKSVFFVSHHHFELKDNESTTRVNTHEAQFLVALCRYVLQQGYQPSQITILTTYLGQLFTLKRLLVGTLQEVRATVVDNFQGEENDIILLSFVRSNEQGVIGFLKTDNRVCVALSRAKKGLFCIGNFDSFAEGSPLWANITEELTKFEAIGPALNLKCQVHGQVESMTSAFDFQRVPDGGCSLPCDFRLLCGHVCPKMCHSLDREHVEFKCQKRCERIVPKCTYQHKCPKRCHEVCGPCEEIVLKTIPKCNHQINMYCHIDENNYTCTIPCPNKLPCGHRCRKLCGDVCGVCYEKVNETGPCGHDIRIECLFSKDNNKLKEACTERCPLILECGHHCKTRCGKPCQTVCNENVLVNLPCGHQARTTCEKSKDIDGMQKSCLVKCPAELECGHKCPGTCGKCFQGRLHVLCNRKCNKNLVCGHPCKFPCSANCPPCGRICENKCQHSHCRQMCGFPCPPCQEICKWGCKHYKCTAKCGEACNRPPCNKYCFRKLRCGHRCVGMCGEPCPRLCRICNRDELQQIFFGHEDHKNARFLELQDCQHTLEIRGLTKWVETQAIAEGGVVKVLECPICKTPIRKNLRFGNQVKTTLANIEKVKGKIFGKIDENEELQKTLRYKVEDFVASSSPTLLFLSERVYSAGCAHLLLRALTEGKPVLDHQTLTSIENVLAILDALSKVQKSLQRDVTKHALFLREVHATEDTLDVPKYKVKTYVKSLLEKIHRRMEKSVPVCAQFMIDLQMETTRCQKAANILETFGKTRVNGSQKFKDTFDSIMADLLGPKPFSQKDLEELSSKQKELLELSEGAVLGITEDERVMIVNAMGFSQGHWYTCPNGHVYCIADCGGAMEESRCNECKAVIGGQQHRLTSGNRVATAMDGARHAAWSEQANMNNYDL